MRETAPVERDVDMSRENLELLALRHLDGTATPDEREIFSRALSRDPSLARWYMATAHREVIIAKLLRTEPLERTRARPSWTWMAVAASIALVIGTWTWVANSGSVNGLELCRLVSGSGEVRRLGQVKPLTAGAVIYNHDEMTVTIHGARLAYPDGSAVTLDEGSSIRLWDESGAKRVRLDRGAVHGDIANQRTEKSMLLLTAHAAAEIVGTRFSLSVENAKTRLDVEEGKVSLCGSTGVAVPVLTGHWATVTAGQSPRLDCDVLYSADYATIPAGDKTPNELARLQEIDGEVTAIMSQPGPAGTPTWKPEVCIEYYRPSSDHGTEQAIFAIPEGVEIRIRIKSERPGTWDISLVPTNPRFRNEHFSAGNFEVGPQWREVVLRSADFMPYMTEGTTRNFIPGVQIARFGIYGFKTGKLFLDRLEVVSSDRNGNSR
jgi:ferric-dicitrate binding protein FerR (iron transport regulator)